MDKLNVCIFLIEDDDLLEKCNTIWDKFRGDIKKSFDNNFFFGGRGITKPCTQLHPAPSTPIQLILTSTQLIPVSTQLSATPSTIFGPKYSRNCT